MTIVKNELYGELKIYDIGEDFLLQVLDNDNNWIANISYEESNIEEITNEISNDYQSVKDLNDLLTFITKWLGSNCLFAPTQNELMVEFNNYFTEDMENFGGEYEPWTSLEDFVKKCCVNHLGVYFIVDFTDF